MIWRRVFHFIFLIGAHLDLRVDVADFGIQDHVMIELVVHFADDFRNVSVGTDTQSHRDLDNHFVLHEVHLGIVVSQFCILPRLQSQ